MKKVFKKILDCDDINAVKNCVSIMAENEEIGMNDRAMLENMKQLQGEIDSCNFDEDTARLHLCLIGQIDSMEAARVNFHKVQYDRVNEWDFAVLWAEMVKMHGKKIRKWFPGIREVEFENRILDECRAFLDDGKLPYYDLKV